MEQASGLLSKISNSQHRLLTMEGELLLDGDILVSEGFHSNLDLSNVVVTKQQTKQQATSGLFSQSKFVSSGSDASECLDLSDDCTTPNDCDCDCAECVAP
jgi:hypothetical protein